MGIGNISTLALFQSTIGDINNKLGSLADLQIQVSSGQKSQDFAGLGPDSIQFLNLQAQISKTDLYIDNNTTVIAYLEGANTALSQAINAATTLSNLIATRRSGTSGNTTNFVSQIEGQWRALVGILNITSNGQYVFSGSATNVKSVDDKNFPLNLDKGVPDANYYKGSAQDLTLRPQDNVSLTYNVRADHPGFQKIFTALSLARQTGEVYNDQDLAQAYDMVQDGIQDLITAQSTVNVNKVNINTINSNLQSYKLYWKGLKESIGNTDLVAASTQIAVDQGILQAAFQAFARISSLRLSNFLPNS